MKKILALSFLALFLVASIAMVSAQDGYKTLIAGKIYDSPDFETAGAVSGATVYVTCNSITKTATSKIDGTYSIEYTPEEGCYNIQASAYATLGAVTSNTMTADIQNYTQSFNLYLGVINIALIPEFGVFVGALTLLSAVGVFFLVRRK